jgi:type IV pilus assembly protein PilE
MWGFTLIEVLIVVAIIAILAAIAYPSYTEQVRRSRRADAKAALLEAAQWMERQYSVSNSYAFTGSNQAMTDAVLRAAPLQALSSTAPFYTLGFLAAPTARAYTLTMTPIGGMATDKCGTLSVTNTGERSQTGSGVTVAECWDR